LYCTHLTTPVWPSDAFQSITLTLHGLCRSQNRSVQSIDPLMMRVSSNWRHVTASWWPCSVFTQSPLNVHTCRQHMAVYVTQRQNVLRINISTEIFHDVNMTSITRSNLHSDQTTCVSSVICIDCMLQYHFSQTDKCFWNCPLNLLTATPTGFSFQCVGFWKVLNSLNDLHVNSVINIGTT